jgi:hypothetical protein
MTTLRYVHLVQSMMLERLLEIAIERRERRPRFMVEERDEPALAVGETSKPELAACLLGVLDGRAVRRKPVL